MSDEITPPKPPRKRRASRRRGASGRRDQAGVALIMVLAAIALMFVMAEQTRDDVEVYALSAAVARDQLIAEAQARSAVNLARVVLNSEPIIRRVIAPILTPLMAMMGRGLAAPPQIPVWEQADLIIGPFRSQEGATALGDLARVSFDSAKNLGGLTGLAPVVIIDEDSRINVNAAVRSSVAQILLAKQLQGLTFNPGTPTVSSPTGRRCSPTSSTTSTSTRRRSTRRASWRAPRPRPRPRPRTASTSGSGRPVGAATRRSTASRSCG